MERNDVLARDVRARLKALDIPSFNLVSSPGSGKTLLLERTLRDLGDEMHIGVVTGDVQTQNDADRIAQWTDQLVQAVVTGGACHLDASQVTAALEALELSTIDLLMIENVGNLVCPASWDLGETAKIVVFSVTEGEDKPLKYPKMFQKASYAVLNKTDLLPHVPFDVEKAKEFALQVNPQLRFFMTSALTGEGLEAWYDFLRAQARSRRRSRTTAGAGR